MPLPEWTETPVLVSLVTELNNVFLERAELRDEVHSLMDENAALRETILELGGKP